MIQFKNKKYEAYYYATKIKDYIFTHCEDLRLITISENKIVGIKELSVNEREEIILYTQEDNTIFIYSVYNALKDVHEELVPDYIELECRLQIERFKAFPDITILKKWDALKYIFLKNKNNIRISDKCFEKYLQLFLNDDCPTMNVSPCERLMFGDV